MVTVAALGFGDIPTNAFNEAFNIISNKGWVAFNIKETFFDKSDQTGFSSMIRELIFSVISSCLSHRTIQASTLY